MTEKTRINITAGPEIEMALKRAAKRDRVPIATKAAELLALALSLEEDIALGLIAGSRQKMKVKYVSHQNAWGHL